jgi:branched-chain amino acid transport system permease protein
MGVIQQVVDGVANGSIYAALALAIVLVYRATGIINFAQGEMGVIAAYVAWSLTSVGVPVYLAVLAAVVLSLPFGALTERLLVRRSTKHSHLTAVVVTVGLLILLNGLIGVIWGNVNKPFPAIFPDGVVRFAGTAVAVAALCNIAVLLLTVAAMQLLFQGTRFGLALRAVADNPESSALSGLPVGRLLMSGWALAAALAGLAACLIAPKTQLHPAMMNAVLIYALAAAVLGGLDSPMGAVVAAFAIGIIENLAGTYVDAIGRGLAIAVPLLLMIVVLLVRPQGLFGRREAVRV